MDPYYFAMIIGEAFIVCVWFFAGWMLAYVAAGSLLKVWLVRGRAGGNDANAIRIGPVFFSHLIYSLVFLNPYVLLYASWELGSEILFICGLIAVCFVFPVTLEFIQLRFLSKWKWFRWFGWKGSIVRILAANVLIGLLGVFTGIKANEAYLTVAGTFPLRPKAYAWKVETSIKTLVNHSVPSSMPRILSDQEHVYIRTGNADAEWVVVSISNQTFSVDSEETIGYVEADDGLAAWKLRNSPEGISCTRMGSEDFQCLFKGIPGQKVYVGNVCASKRKASGRLFLKQQLNGRIIGTDYSRGILFALDPYSGDLVWKAEAPPTKHGDRRIGSLSAGDGVVALGLWSTRVWVVDARSGRTLWQWNEQEGYGNTVEVSVANGKVHAISRSDKSYSFEARSGKPGTVQEGCYGDAGNRYGITSRTSGRRLTFLDRDGKPMFQTSIPVKPGIKHGASGIRCCPGEIYAPPIITDQHAYVFCADGTLWALDMAKIAGR